MAYGSVVAGFKVHKDFVTYSHGVYISKTSEVINNHTVKIIGKLANELKKI